MKLSQLFELRITDAKPGPDAKGFYIAKCSKDSKYNNTMKSKGEFIVVNYGTNKKVMMKDDDGKIVVQHNPSYFVEIGFLEWFGPFINQDAALDELVMLKKKT